MRTQGRMKDIALGGGPADELGAYLMRRERGAFRPLGNRGRMGALVFLSGRFITHRYP